VTWVQRQLESSTIEPDLVVQLVPPVPVHVFQDSLGWVSEVTVPACWARAAPKSEREARARDLYMVAVMRKTVVGY
jgi:hypothetical protein